MRPSWSVTIPRLTGELHSKCSVSLLTSSLPSSLPLIVGVSHGRTDHPAASASPCPLLGFPRRIPGRLSRWPLPTTSACQVVAAASSHLASSSSFICRTPMRSTKIRSNPYCHPPSPSHRLYLLHSVTRNMLTMASEGSERYVPLLSGYPCSLHPPKFQIH
jgi:hypothetical protein